MRSSESSQLAAYEGKHVLNFPQLAHSDAYSLSAIGSLNLQPPSPPYRRLPRALPVYPLEY